MARATANSSRYGDATKRRAKFWRISLRTSQKWYAAPGSASTPPAGALDDSAAMLRWVASLPHRTRAKLTRPFLRRCDELRVLAARHPGVPLPSPQGPPGAPPPPPSSGRAAPHAPPTIPAEDPDYADFLAQSHDTPHADAATIDNLKRHQRAALFKLERAQRSGDLAKLKDATDQLAEISRVLDLEEKRAFRQGKETGEFIPIAEWERQVEAAAVALLRCIDAALPGLARRLVGLSFPEEAHARLEAALLRTAFFEPILAASRTASGHALPPRVPGKFLSVMETFLASGRAHALAATTFADGAGI